MQLLRLVCALSTFVMATTEEKPKVEEASAEAPAEGASAEEPKAEAAKVAEDDVPDYVTEEGLNWPWVICKYCRYTIMPPFAAKFRRCEVSFISSECADPDVGWLRDETVRFAVGHHKRFLVCVRLACLCWERGWKWHGRRTGFA